MKGVFVTGTDTGLGKTVACAALMSILRPTREVCYWKPVQTGIEQDNDTQTVRDLAVCAATEIFDEGVRLLKPFSPHLSARLARQEISVAGILAHFADRSPGRFWIIEGAGGVLVPLNDGEMMIDLIAALRIPAVVVARSGLGTINHTLLTLEALRRRGIPVQGVIMNGATDRENRKAIERLGDTAVLAEMPRFEQLGADTLRQWASEGIDPEFFGID